MNWLCDMSSERLEWRLELVVVRWWRLEMMW